MNRQKEQITVNVNLVWLECISAFAPKPSEQYEIDLFLSSSRASTRQFRFQEASIQFSKQPQALEVKNVVGDKVEFWLSCTHPSRKLIGVGSLDLNAESSEDVVSLKLQNQEFAKLQFTWAVTRRSIEKQVQVEPDEVILRKRADPGEQLLKFQQEQRRRLREGQQHQEQELALKKKPIITLTTQNKKEQPFT